MAVTQSYRAELLLPILCPNTSVIISISKGSDRLKTGGKDAAKWEAVNVTKLRLNGVDRD
jgi:hypothetical protein